MDAFRRQASKFKEQVAKQQQAVIKQFSGTGYESSDVMVIDEVEMQRHQQLEKLYRSTRGGKDFQKDIVRAAEAMTALGLKHIETGTKLSEDCCKYGIENTHDNILAKAATIYGDARIHVEKEQEDLNKSFSSQVLEPLKAMIAGAPLEDARHLAQRYSRMRQEAETLAADISRRRAKARELHSSENAAKLHAAESRMQEVKANMAILGKEAAAALAAVEAQQQRLSFQRLVALVRIYFSLFWTGFCLDTVSRSLCSLKLKVESEKVYHQRVAVILGEVEAEMVSEKQQKESAPPTVVPSDGLTEKTKYFLAEAMHSFVGNAEKELSLAVGDYVVVRKVDPSGWSEGECKGKAGWFPSAYVEKRHRIPSSGMAAEVF